jgi:RHS repeat-associated protein
MYMQARYYDPVIGRFYSNDPVDVIEQMQRGNSAVHGFNRYAYVNNNPYKYTDPDGKYVVVTVDPKAAGGNGHTFNTYYTTACRAVSVFRFAR